jgi:pimeloyl-ACP methyl ester carboxylesterase
MKKILLILFCFPIIGFGQQTLNIGHTSINFYDNSRNRNINTEIYYPANINGDDVAISIGNFPVIVFGHGFLIGWEAYENFWISLVSEGYILCFPTTEMGITPNHQLFADDLRFIASQVQIESQISSSIFYNSVLPETAVMGHSMGGGTSFLAAENNPNFNTLINFAAAETNPSAILAATNITIPSLIFSAEDDCVSPPISNQNIMFDSLSSTCKTQINITNGGHCYFANENFLCDFGESSCNTSLNITRSEQQNITNDFLKIWLNFYLKSDQNSLSVFNDSLQASNKITYTQFCNSSSLVLEQPINKAVLKVIDLLGRETKELTNQPLFYIYDDGTVEKKIILEGDIF